MPYENPIINDIKKGTFHPVYLLYGPEPYLRRNYKDKLIRALVKPGDSINFSKFNEDNYDSEALVELCQTMPLFAEKRVVLCDLCRAFSKSDEKLSDYLSSPNDSTVLIFTEEKTPDKRTKTYKALMKNALLYECALPPQADQRERILAQWIGGRFKMAGKVMENDAWTRFYQRTSSSMDLMNNEYEKLLSYVGDREVVTVSDVEAVTSGHLEETVFSLIDAITERNAALTGEIYESLLEDKASPDEIIRIIEGQFNKILIARDMSEEGADNRDIATRSGINIYFVGKTLARSRSFSRTDIINFLKRAEYYERLKNSGRIDPYAALELLIGETLKN